MGMSNRTIHIMHRPTGLNLCQDGVFRSGVTFLYKGGKDTLMYRSVGHALRRLNCRTPFKRIPTHMLDDCALSVVETSPGGFCAYRLDRHGNEIADGHGGNSQDYPAA
jgi:hypothetical protein